MSEEELMAFLQQKPYLFGLVRDKSMMKVIKVLEYGGRTPSHLAKLFDLDEEKLIPVLDDLVHHKVLEKKQIGVEWMYYLNFEGKKFLELYKKTKKEYE